MNYNKILLAVILLLSYPILTMNTHTNNGTKKAIIFDLDGTLADTTDFVFYQCWNKIAEANGYPQMKNEDVAIFKQEGVSAFMKRANISTLKIPYYAKLVFDEMNNNIEKIKPIEGIVNSLKALKEQGYTLGVVTSNSKNNAEKFLKNTGIHELFDFVYSEESIFSKFKALFDKGKIIQNCITKYDLDPKNSYYVGDEVRDIEAAKYASIKSISVTWGFNSKNLLLKNKPDYLVETTNQLLDLFSTEQQAASINTSKASV